MRKKRTSTVISVRKFLDTLLPVKNPKSVSPDIIVELSRGPVPGYPITGKEERYFLFFVLFIFIL